MHARGLAVIVEDGVGCRDHGRERPTQDDSRWPIDSPSWRPLIPYGTIVQHTTIHTLFV